MTLAGSPFPAFTLLTDTGAPLSLSSLLGRTVVLYFYPKDDTTGCTQESCEFRDMFPRFAAGDAVILGISPDDVASHQKFKAKYNLPFTLLVDENHALAEQLGIWVEKQFMGNRYMGVQRTTFVIGADGTVRHVFEKVNPAGHADEVMAFLQGGADSAVAARATFEAAPPPALSPAPVAPKSAPRAAKAPAKAPAKQVVKDAAKQAAPKKAAKKAVKKAAKKAVKKAAKKVVKKAAKKVVKKAAKKVAKKVVRKAAAKPAKKMVRRAMKKVVKKVSRKPAGKPVKRAAKRVVKRPARAASKKAAPKRSSRRKPAAKK